MRQYLRLGILLILVADLTGCGEEERPKQTIEQLEKYAWFYDGWTNQDKNTNHITRVHLYYRDGGIYVHMWGRPDSGNGKCVVSSPRAMPSAFSPPMAPLTICFAPAGIGWPLSSIVPLAPRRLTPGNR